MMNPPVHSGGCSHVNSSHFDVWNMLSNIIFNAYVHKMDLGPKRKLKKKKKIHCCEHYNTEDQKVYFYFFKRPERYNQEVL